VARVAQLGISNCRPEAKADVRSVEDGSDSIVHRGFSAYIRVADRI